MVTVSASVREPTDGEKAQTRGIAYLSRSLTHSAASNRFSQVGAKALAGYTLLHCDVSPDDQAVEKVLSSVRIAAQRLTQTYEIATCVWFLDKLNHAEDKPLITSLSLRLIAGQGERGGWGYTCPVLSADQEKQLLELLWKSPTEKRPALAKAQNAKPAKLLPVKSTGAIISSPQGAPVTLKGNVTGLPVLPYRTGQTLAEKTPRHH